jgi:hypothetical protein
VASSPLCDSILVESMSIVTQLYFQIVEEINDMFRPFSGWAIIRLRLEYRRKLIYYNVDIKNGGMRSCFTMFPVVLRRTFIHLISTSINICILSSSVCFFNQKCCESENEVSCVETCCCFDTCC